MSCILRIMSKSQGLLLSKLDCPIAQLAERRAVNSDVPGSSPGGAAGI